MAEASAADEASVATCSCERAPRRACDLCRSARHAFLACSLACLRQHRAAAHADPGETSTEARVRQSVREMNRNAPDGWARYAAHRAHTMRLVTSVSGARSLCVFGAGNCADVDLEHLTASFERVHLVDVDGEALERARDRQPERVRARIVNHGDVDLSGLLDRLDVWGESFPADAELGPAAVAAARRIVAALGQRFDVALSSCVLSQLIIPFQFSWVLPESTWAKFDSVITAVHLATLSGCLEAGGRGFLAFDVLSSDAAPGLLRLANSTSEDLAAFVTREMEAENLELNPDPASLLERVGATRSMMANPELTLPWLWDIGSAQQLVYCLSFERPAPPSHP